MRCDSVFFSGHALIRMFDRKISKNEVANIIRCNELVADYPDDQPYPSRLLLGFIQDKPIHVVVAGNKVDHSCIVITAYIPSLALWNAGFKTRKQK